MQSEKTVLITGGAGFVGCNLAERLLKQPGLRVKVFDNLSRSGVRHNLAWLRSLPGAERLDVIVGDVTDAPALKAATRGVNEVYHLAAQVAVTTSIGDPFSDFEVNARGTLNMLEAARSLPTPPFVLFTSTNKVYGSLDALTVTKQGTRCVADKRDFRGISEAEPLDFHSPYGCSKGAADQYVRDYARIYGIDSVVFRMSCIAGPRQFGNEDQGWVAHFLYSVLQGSPITVCGDGLQVRDLLHVHDLVDAMMAARENRKRLRGQVFNLGGGVERTMSVLELLHECERRFDMPLHLNYTDVRPGDQPLYISNTSKLERETGWRARRSVEDILSDIEAFWHQEHETIEQGYVAAAHGMMAEEVA